EWSPLAVADASVETYVDPNAALGETYWYRLRATDPPRESDPSNLADLTVPGAQPPNHPKPLKPPSKPPLNPPPVLPTATPNASVEPPILRFPTVSIGSTSDAQGVRIHSTGKAPLIVERPRVAGGEGFVIVGPSRLELQPDRSATIRVVFKPAHA